MPKLGLVNVTALTLLLTGFSVHQAGWLAKKKAPSAEMERQLQTPHPLASEEAYRHRANLSKHWRSLVMHH